MHNFNKDENMHNFNKHTIKVISQTKDMIKFWINQIFL